MVPLISQIDRVLNSTNGTVRILRDPAPRSIPPVQDGARKTANVIKATKLFQNCATLVTERRVKNLNFLDQDLLYSFHAPQDSFIWTWKAFYQSFSVCSKNSCHLMK